MWKRPVSGRSLSFHGVPSNVQLYIVYLSDSTKVVSAILINNLTDDVAAILTLPLSFKTVRFERNKSLHSESEN